MEPEMMKLYMIIMPMPTERVKGKNPQVLI